MAEQKYSTVEALNRILRLLSSGMNNVPTEAPNTVPPPLYSEDEAISLLAELLAGSLESDDLGLPGSMVASVDEANAGSVNDKALTPASHSWAHEYGGIYVSTGIAQQSFTQDTWQKITGAFQNYMLDSGAEILCDWNDDRIVINEVGTYYVSYQLSVFTPDGGLSILKVRPYVNGTAQPQATSEVQFDVSGSVTSLSGLGAIEIVTGGYAVDLRAAPNASIDVQVAAGQIFVEKQNG